MNNVKSKNKENEDNFSNYIYRPCAGAMVFNNEGKIFVGRRLKRSGFGDLAWQMPQGGIDSGEKPTKAARRELYEETGIKKVKLIAKTRSWLYYDLPKDLIGVALKGKYKGQKQKWFLFQFKGKDKDISLKNPGHQQEFDDYKWVDINDLPDIIVPFKKDIYQTLVVYFTPIVKEYTKKAKMQKS